MTEKTESSHEATREEKDQEWINARKSKRPTQETVRKSKSKGKDEKFIEIQAENEVEDLLVKTAFSTLL